MLSQLREFGVSSSSENGGTPNIPHVVLSGTFDLAGDMTSQSATIAGTADFQNTYAYNGDQQLATVQQEGVNGGNVVSPKEIDYAYNALGQVTSAIDYNTLSGPRTDVLTGTFSYDTDARLTQIAYTSTAGANTIDTFGYGYNAAGLVTSFSSIDGMAAYSYGPTNELTSASYTTASGGHQPADESYSYTANGNRNSSGYTTGSDNLMSSDGTYDYQYDADGNLISRTQIASTYSAQYQTTYTWNYRNRLTDVEYHDNNGVLMKHVHFVYDVFNDLIGEEDDNTGGGSYDQEQWYVNEGGQPVLAFDGSGALIERNLVAPNPAGVDAVMAQGAVASLASGDVVTWAADDKLGTPREILSNSGTVLNHIVDNAFGVTAYESDPSVTWWAGFAGGHDDVATDLVLNGRRWYDPSTGKWLSPDPINFRGHDGDLTRYVGNDPTNAIDPSGEVSMGQVGTMAVTPMWMWPMILAGEAQQTAMNKEIAAAAVAQNAQMQAMTAQGLAMQQAMNIASYQQASAQQAQMQATVAQGVAMQQAMNASSQQQAAAQQTEMQQVGAAAPFPFTSTSVAIASAVMGQAGAPAAPPPAPGLGAQILGGLGGAIGGAINMGAWATAGAFGTSSIIVGAAQAAAALGLITTAPAWGTIGVLVGIAFLGGTGLGLITGGVMGWNQNGLGAGFSAAVNDPAISTVGLGVGIVIGIGAFHGGEL